MDREREGGHKHPAHAARTPSLPGPALPQQPCLGAVRLICPAMQTPEGFSDPGYLSAWMCSVVQAYLVLSERARGSAQILCLPLSIATRGCPASPRPTHVRGPPAHATGQAHGWPFPPENLVTSSPCCFHSCSAGCGRSPAPPSLAHIMSLGRNDPAGALASPPLGDEMPEKGAGAPGPMA